MIEDIFSKLEWKGDRVMLGDVVFRLQHYLNDDWELGDNCFLFFKVKDLIDEYETLWSSKGSFYPKNILEIGIWDGGSTVFWFECFEPEKIVGIDISTREDSKYFQHYVKSRGFEHRINTYWGVNQSDSINLRSIVNNEFTNPLDLVIDDGSHLYEDTKASFEILFPLIRPGGLYIIEDWAWAHWKEFDNPENYYFPRKELSKFIFELVEVTGSVQYLISNISIYHGFVVVERGSNQIEQSDDFQVNNYIYRLPGKLISRRIIYRLLKKYHKIIKD